MSGPLWFLLGAAVGSAGPAWWLSWRYGIDPFAAFHDEARKWFHR